MVAFVIGSSRGVEIVPVLVVDRDPLLGSVPVVHVIVTSTLLLEVMGVVHVRVIVEAVPVSRLASSCSLNGARISKHRHQGEQSEPGESESPEHSFSPQNGGFIFDVIEHGAGVVVSVSSRRPNSQVVSEAPATGILADEGTPSET